MKALLALASTVLLAPLAGAQVLPEFGVDDLRISDAGVDGDPEFQARRPSVAYNPVAGEYLVVWSGRDGDVFAGTFAQRIDAATGAEIGTNDIVVSDNGTGSAATAVVFNTTLEEYIVVWSSYWGGEMGIYGRRYDGATGEPIADEVQIHSTDDVNTRLKGLVYNAATDECFMLWRERLPGNPSFQESLVVGRFRPATLSPLGPFPTEVTPEFFLPASEPNVALNSLANEYLVAWSYQGTLYGQRFDAVTGLEIGDDDFVITDLPGLLTNSATPVLYDPDQDRYLVGWSINGGIRARAISATGLPVGDELEITNAEGINWAHCYLARNTHSGEALVTWVEFEGDAIEGPVSDSVAFDANGDGLPDVCLGTDNGVNVVLGAGGGKLSRGIETNLDTTVRSLASGDFDGDGIEDVAVTTTDLNGPYILAGVGDGTFTEQSQLFLGGFFFDTIAADFTGDGTLDLAFLDALSDSVVLVTGVGDGTFVSPVTTVLPGNAQSFTVADANGDARADLAVLTDTPNQVTLYTTDPGPVLTQESVIAISPALGFAPQVEAGDANGDGNLDVVVAGVEGFGNFGALVFLSDELGDFAPPERVTVANDTLYSSLEDLDDDGFPELLVGIQEGLFVFQGSPEATYTESELIPFTAVTSSGTPYGLGVLTPTVADLDGDGNQDVIAPSGFGDASVAVFLGNGDGSVEPARRYGGNDVEIQGRRISPSGELIGQGSFEISSMGVPWEKPASAFGGASAFDPEHSRFLVTWSGYDAGPSGNASETEVHGQLLSVCPPAAGTEVVRTGSANNPVALMGGAAGAPAIGEPWRPSIDHTTFAPDSLSDWLLLSTAPADIPFGPAGNLLCAPLPGGYFLFQTEPGGSFEIPIPANCAFAGFTLCTQGVSFGPGSTLLTNALDVTIGS